MNEILLISKGNQTDSRRIDSLGHQCYSFTQAHHQQLTFNIVCIQNHGLLPAKRDQPLMDELAGARTGIGPQNYKTALFQLLHGQHFFIRQRSFGRHGHTDGPSQNLRMMAALHANLSVYSQSNVAFVILQLLSNCSHRTLPQLHVDLRMNPVKYRNRRQKKLLLHGPGIGNGKLGFLLLACGKTPQNFLIGFNQRLCLGQKDLSLFG